MTSTPVTRASLGPEVIAVAGLLVIAAFGLFGQSADRPRFAVASIKPNPSTGPRSMEAAMGAGYRPGGRFVASNATVPFLIQRAYGVESFQVVGGPSWIRTEGYDIEAKPEATTDQTRMWLMVQTLLADRFKLSMAREKRTPGFRSPGGEERAETHSAVAACVLRGAYNSAGAGPAATRASMRPRHSKLRHRAGDGRNQRVYAGAC